ncbi:hypothetical protein ACFXJ8_31660 [Nonomuraea sp. NPDC059194]|uniref:hypothetical protein n=1 Tax=Nonomuraea sp. NPDC059194 TaxID=3346764 RepID=UPI0036AB0F7A
MPIFDHGRDPVATGPVRVAEDLLADPAADVGIPPFQRPRVRGAEAGSMSSFTIAATSYATHGEPTRCSAGSAPATRWALADPLGRRSIVEAVLKAGK